MSNASDTAELARLREMFEGAGGGEYNVLALVEHLHHQLGEARAKLHAIGRILAEDGCDCMCEHDSESHDADCDRCLGCRIDAVLTHE